MSEKLLVHIEINIWERNVPRVSAERITKETEKCLYVRRQVHPHGWSTSRTVERDCPVQRNILGRVFSHTPGVKKYHFVTDKLSDVTLDSEYRVAVTRMMDEIYAELAEAGNNLAAMEEGLS